MGRNSTGFVSKGNIPGVKSGFLDKLVDRMDRLDPGSLQAQFLRLAGEKGILEAVFDALQEGVVVLDAAGLILFANRASERLFGFDAAEVRGTPIQRHVRDIEWDRVLHLDEAEWSRVVSREIEVSYPEHRYLAFYIVPLPPGVSDTSGGAVVLFRDITRERQTVAETVESERLRAITLLAAGVAHEIGNPLNSLTIHLQLLKREMEALKSAQRKSMRELIAVASGEVQRLDGIITKFLQAVRPMQPRMESCRLDAVVRGTVDFMAREMADRKVWVEFDLPADLPPIRADEGQMRQLFFNLIKNAAEAMSGGGVVKVDMAASDRMVAVTIRDTGVGIEPSKISAVFDPYYTTKQHGSGLGMMIVQRIVRDHGGEIEIRSERGRGTAITVYLPREDRHIRLIPQASPSAGSPERAPS